LAAKSTAETPRKARWEVLRATTRVPTVREMKGSRLLATNVAVMLLSPFQAKAAEWRPSSARFLLFLAPSLGGSLRIGDDIDPLRVRRRLGVVVVVPVPPLVGRCLGVTLWRVLPSLLTTERCDVEIAPDRPHRLVAAVVDEICAEHLTAVAEEHVVPVPFIDAKVLVEAIGHGVP